MRSNKLELRASATSAGRSAIGLAMAAFVVTIIRSRQPLNWHNALFFAAVFGIAWFGILFAYLAVTTRSHAPAREILDQLPSGSAAQIELTGFVAMEYFALILNRTFVVFVAPDGLYGWKAMGSVPAGVPTYFQPYAKMLSDPMLMHDIAAVRKLANLKGGFIIPRSELLSVEVIPKQKPGMGGIPHSGRILIRLASGAKRELILLGAIDANRIKQSIQS